MQCDLLKTISTFSSLYSIYCIYVLCSDSAFSINSCALMPCRSGGDIRQVTTFSCIELYEFADKLISCWTTVDLLYTVHCVIDHCILN